MALGIINVNFFSSALWPIVLAGMRDGVNPFALSSILILLLFVSFSCSSRGKAALSMSLFTLVAAGTYFVISLGGLDQILATSFMDSIVRMLNAVMALVFVILGAANFVDWIKLQKREEASLWIKNPRILDNQDSAKGKKKPVGLINLILLSIILGFVTTILGTFWPQDYFVFVRFFQSVAEGDVDAALGILAIYSMAFIIPLVLTCLSFFVLLSFKRLKMFWLKKISLVKIINSSIFLSLGMGIIYVVLNS